MAKPQKKEKKRPDIGKFLPWVLIIAGLIGLFASFMLMNDKLKILEDPSFKPACSLNPILSCGPVMKSSQASVYGFDNPVIGLAAFPALALVGVAMLAGAKFKRWFWLGLQAGSIFGVAFVHWLIFQSIYRIGALCIYCMIVWVVTIASFVYITFYNYQTGNFKLPARFKPVAEFKLRHHFDLLIVWYLIITILIVNHFWYYFRTLF